MEHRGLLLHLLLLLALFLARTVHPQVTDYGGNEYFYDYSEDSGSTYLGITLYIPLIKSPHLTIFSWKMELGGMSTSTSTQRRTTQRRRTFAPVTEWREFTVWTRKTRSHVGMTMTAHRLNTMAEPMQVLTLVRKTLASLVRALNFVTLPEEGKTYFANGWLIASRSAGQTAGGTFAKGVEIEQLKIARFLKERRCSTADVGPMTVVWKISAWMKDPLRVVPLLLFHSPTPPP